MAEFAYDEVQYDSHPYRQSHPERLYTLAKLFGLNPLDYKKARILELGCASGGNIIPIAYNYPDCQVVGLDLSEKQIEAGKAFAQALNLSNIELLTLSILDVNESLGKFDYIICHGIYSWVPQIVRDKIFTIFRDNLTPQGIAYISYNAYPGWNVVHSMRDMLLFHTSKLETLSEKAGQARLLLQFVAEGLEDEKTPYSEFLNHELDLIKKQPDSYLLHDHLEEVNFPTYFHSFMEQANQNGLDYLADAKISSMFAGNLPENTAKVLGEIPDIIRSNQYMDFIRNQRFRATLLCLNSVKINRQITTNQVEEFYISYIGGYPKEAITQEMVLTEGTPLAFSGAGITLTLRHSVSKVALRLLQSYHQIPIFYPDLVIELQKKLKEYALDYDLEYLDKHLKEELNLMRLVFGGIIELSSDPALYTLKISNTPNTTQIIKEQLKTKNVVTSQRHEVIKLDDLEKVLLEALDGKSSKEEIIEALYQKIQAGTLSLPNTYFITDTMDEKVKISGIFDQLCQKLANSALIVS